MSIAVMTRVWDKSAQKGSALLLLLAIADFANEESISWPSIKTLAKKSRLSDRQCQNVVRQLWQVGEIFISQGDGRGHPNRYFVAVGLQQSVIDQTLKDENFSPFISGKGEIQRAPERVKSSDKRVKSSDKIPQKGEIAIAPDPSLNTDPPKEPSSILVARASEVVQPVPALPVGSLPEIEVEYNPQPTSLVKGFEIAPPKISAPPPPRRSRAKKPVALEQEELPDLELHLMMFAIWKVTGLDYRMVKSVQQEARRYRRLGYAADDVAKAHQLCKQTDWRWTDPKRGNPGRRMVLQDLTNYLGMVKVSGNDFKYAPEMELDQLIRRVRATGDFAALEPGYTPALPSGEATILPEAVQVDDNPFLKKDAPLPIRTVASELDKLNGHAEPVVNPAVSRN